MKKSLFNKSAVAMAAGLFAAFAANAYVVGTAGGAITLPGAGSTAIPEATALNINAGGLGHQLFVPYYSAQNGNRTYLTIVNTDMRNGKAVKVRFRGASNSDDVLDFTVFMSPGDAWTAVVYAATNANPARLEVVEGDTTCTAPAIPAGGVEFRTFRLHPQLTPDLIASETREGYIEIFNEADIPPAASVAVTVPVTPPTLYQAINHVAGTGAPFNCDAVRATTASLSRVDPTVHPRTALAGTTNIQDMAIVNGPGNDYNDARGRGFEVPTSGLMASWAIANPANSRAWSGNAVAVEAQDAAGAPGYGNIVYHPQRGDSVTLAVARQRTSDPLLRGGGRNNNVAPGTMGNPPDNTGAAINIDLNPVVNGIATPSVTPLSVDFPDMSTPYLWANLATLANGVATRAQAQNLTAALATQSVSNEILTIGSGRTDWTFTFPTRRYNVARAYATGANEGVGTTQYTDYRHDDAGGAIATGRNYFNPVNVVSDTAAGRRHQLCVSGIAFNGGAKGGVEGGSLNRHSGVTGNREESFVATSSGIDFSPAPPAALAAAFCGEAGVFSYNRVGVPTGVLNAAVAPRNFDTSGRAFGWMRYSTLGLVRGAGGNNAQAAATTPGATNADGLGLPVVGLAFWTFENMSIVLPHRNN
jgi:hypothetical protein